jgi:predicted PurR-regulated permease PerM
MDVSNSSIRVHERSSYMTFSSEPSRSTGWGDSMRAFASAVYPRLVGMLIIFKLMIPLLILGFLIAGLWSMVRSVNAEFDRLNASLQPKFERAEAEIEKIRAEGRRLAEKVAEIKNKGAQVAEDIKSSVEPIRQSLLAISNTVGAISATMESVINAIVRVVNKIPFVRGLKGVHLPRINIPGFSLPNLNVDLKLNFDMTAVGALKEVIGQIADEAEAAIDSLKNIWLTWWWTFKVMAFLVLCWFLLFFIGIMARFWHKLKTGMQLLSGHTTTASLQIL